MKLTTEQIDQLFLFTRQHYVEWYDLQSELVDHLANAIETDWEQNPTISFEAALQNEFKKFGVFGFVDVVEKRRGVLKKKYYKIVCEYFKDFFSFPKIISTIAAILGLFIILKLSVNSRYIFIGIYLLLFVAMFYELYKNHQNRKKRKKSGQKRWLFEEVIHNYGYLAGALSFPFNMMSQVFYQSDDFFIYDYEAMGLSFFLISFGVFLFIIFKIIPSKAESYLLATYPEYKLE
ncbi:hypothetical protein [Flavobacterium sp.]|uniref:hypothetical protein n=1 Tax=Flavobacterium sp. TaxID=239 RepID=UPI00262726CF|nr:hypothetical protein [Flavobacterium sp.]MDG2433101.1 hypothetical protein [Flavobacterium sp.]